MSYGPVARANLSVTDPAPKGAPVLTVANSPDGGSFNGTATNGSDADIVGCTVAYIERESPDVDPTEGLDMEQIKSLDGVRLIQLPGGPDQSLNFGQSWDPEFANGDAVVFCAATTDDPEDLVSE